jgi:hypothetical protein
MSSPGADDEEYLCVPDEAGADPVPCTWVAGVAGQDQTCDTICAAAAAVDGGEADTRPCLAESLLQLWLDTSCATHADARRSAGMVAWGGCSQCGPSDYTNVRPPSTPRFSPMHNTLVSRLLPGSRPLLACWQYPHASRQSCRVGCIVQTEAAPPALVARADVLLPRSDRGRPRSLSRRAAGVERRPSVRRRVHRRPRHAAVPVRLASTRRRGPGLDSRRPHSLGFRRVLDGGRWLRAVHVPWAVWRGAGGARRLGGKDGVAAFEPSA